MIIGLNNLNYLLEKGLIGADLEIRQPIFVDNVLTIILTCLLLRLCQGITIFSSPVGSLCHTRGVVRRPSFVFRSPSYVACLLCPP